MILPVVPMFHANAWGLAHAAVATGADLVMPGPDLSGPAIANLIVDETGHGRRRRADDLDGGAARAEGPRHLVAAGDPVRRVGGAEGAVGGVPRADRPADPPGLGDDRDQPDRCRCAASTPTRSCCRTTSRPTCARQVGRIVFGVECRVVEPGTTDAGAVGRRDAAANCSAVATGSRRDYYDDERAGESFTDDGWLQHRRRRHGRRARVRSAWSTAPRT